MRGEPPEAAAAREAGLGCAALDWSRPPPCLGEFDLLVGSDLVYSEATASLLGRVLASLMSAGAVGVAAARGGGIATAAATAGAATRCGGCLLAHTAERWGASGYDAALLAALRANSLLATPLDGASAPTSTWVDDDARIEQRGVIFRICPARPPLEDAAAARVLLRACRAQAALDALALATMSADERAEVEASAQFAALLEGELP